jgi:alpha-mannosidase
MLTRELRLVRGDDHLEISDTLDKLRAEVKERGNPQDPNNGKEAVHFAFPFNVPGGQIQMDVPWAVVTPEKDQMPGACKNWFTVQRWVDISNGERGVTWSPIDAPLVEVGGITATLIGSQTNPDVWQKRVDPHATSLYSWAMNNYWHTNYRAYQEGVTTFRYRIRPHGPPSLAETQRFGIEQSQPFIVVPARDRKPAVAGAPRPKIDSPDVFLTAFKPADDGKGYILRLFAGAGRDVDVLLEWEGKAPAAVYRSDTLESRGGEKVSRPIHLAAWEVLTLRAE